MPPQYTDHADQVIEKQTTLRLKILGVKPDVAAINAIGTIKEDYLGYFPPVLPRIMCRLSLTCPPPDHYNDFEPFNKTKHEKKKKKKKKKKPPTSISIRARESDRQHSQAFLLASPRLAQTRFLAT